MAPLEQTEQTPKHILLLGHRSFAAQGLLAHLVGQGHQVTCFSRGPMEREGDTVTGTLADIAVNPHLSDSYDVVVNYILLKDEPVASNVAYIDALLDLCRKRKVGHLVHLSSISVYKANQRNVTEDSPAETIPERKGSYGSLKVATDTRLLDQLPEGLRLSLVRPGFILGTGLLNPIVGTGLRLPSNRLLAMGDARNQMPLVSRELVNQAIGKIIGSAGEAGVEVFLLADRKSPSRLQYLQACCRELGCGLGVVHVPVWLWLFAGFGGELAARLTGKASLKPWSKIRGVCRRQSFDSAGTERRLSLDLSFDWESTLRNSMEGQEPNFVPINISSARPTSLNARSITFIGFGRIVRQKYLPALRRLAFGGNVEAYDLRAFTDPSSGQEVKDLATSSPTAADIFVVASPGPAHARALDLLRGFNKPVLVEKPLCYSPRELELWTTFASNHKAPVFVCHNYRFKRNVRLMLETMKRANPGRLIQVSVQFQSPPVRNESAVWLRNERSARTLLLDYGLHFLDVACMFGKGEWQPSGVRSGRDTLGDTAFIEGRLEGEAYAVAFLLRQGFAPRRARLFFTFQNYGVSLGFFPDTCVIHMANDNPLLYRREAMAAARATAIKVRDKLTGRDSDDSHDRVLASVAGATGDCDMISVNRLADFYRVLFKLSTLVYGE